MTPSLEWTGFLTAAVSAVHALGTLLRLYWERRPAGGKAGRSPAVEGPWCCEGRCRSAPGVAAVRVEVAAGDAVLVCIVVAAGPVGSDMTAGGGPGPW